jgi:hypothetical protein
MTGRVFVAERPDDGAARHGLGGRGEAQCRGGCAAVAAGFVGLVVAACSHAGPSQREADVPAAGGDAEAPAAPAAPRSLVCPAAEVRAMAQAIAVRAEDLAEPAPAVSIVAAALDAVTLAARGPILDALHRRDVAYRVDCTASGLAIEATIVQLTRERGAVLKNILWQPTITLQATPSGPIAEVRATWRMRLPDGTELDRAQTPPYAERTYPITVATTISRSPTR